ncbi:hypothetical protein VB618_04430 [Microvirga sp. CF3062]|uniref:hypothetical protein n=1 Tax=Microvirga sp. CF3062 TaxID=3110182 RepID=UPI002E78D894|nr:hypothetical protein [Microvirga sp. CF3062]MEE1655435.1 hypothetical protein [Microvirga sp. CF3062]
MSILHASQKYRFGKGQETNRTLCIEEFSVGFKDHEKPFPAWYPYAFVGGIAALATALYVMG